MESCVDVPVDWHDVPELESESPEVEVPEFRSESPDVEAPDVDSDGENRRERNDYEIEKEVMTWVDEPRVKHNFYPGTEDDSEEEGEEIQKTVYQRNDIKRGNGELSHEGLCTPYVIDMLETLHEKASACTPFLSGDSSQPESSQGPCFSALWSIIMVFKLSFGVFKLSFGVFKLSFVRVRKGKIDVEKTNSGSGRILFDFKLDLRLGRVVPISTDTIGFNIG
ncbi:hypothetical protein YC2023_067644 [Brassica napus]